MYSWLWFIGIEEYPAKTLSLIVRCRNAANSDLLGISAMPIAVNEARLTYICVVEVQMDIRVGVLLHLCDVAQQSALESLWHGRRMWGSHGAGVAG
jgi:hypothetical protein